MLQRVFAALSYFTRIPSPYPQDRKPPKGSSCYAPLVGWVVGMFSALVFVCIAYVLPLSLAVVFSVISSILLTRGLHEDGWADFCDGFGGGWDREATLRIMRDPNCGVFALLGLTVVVLTKLLSVFEIAQHGGGHWLIITTFISAHAISRLAAVSMMRDYDYAGDATTTRAGHMSARMRGGDFIVALVTGLAPLVGLAFVAGSEVLALIFLVWAVRWVLARQIITRLGGYTGDCMGAIQQISEVVFYLGLLALLGAQGQLS